MKRIIIALSVLLQAGQLLAQTETKTTAPTTSAEKPKSFSIPPTTEKRMDYFRFEANWCSWVGTPDSIKLKPLSRGLNTYFMYPMDLGKSDFKFTVGGGISVDNYYHDVRIYQDSANVNHTFSISSFKPKNNKFTTAYMEAPILLSYKGKADKFGKSIKVSAGLKLGYILASRYKYHGATSGGKTVFTKSIGLPNISKSRISASATFGYDWFYVVANYSLTPYFLDGKGVKLNPFSIGIGFTGF